MLAIGALTVGDNIQITRVTATTGLKGQGTFQQQTHKILMIKCHSRLDEKQEGFYN